MSVCISVKYLTTFSALFCINVSHRVSDQQNSKEDMTQSGEHSFISLLTHSFIHGSFNDMFSSEYK